MWGDFILSPILKYLLIFYANFESQEPDFFQTSLYIQSRAPIDLSCGWKHSVLLQSKPLVSQDGYLENEEHTVATCENLAHHHLGIFWKSQG